MEDATGSASPNAEDGEDGRVVGVEMAMAGRLEEDGVLRLLATTLVCTGQSGLDVIRCKQEVMGSYQMQDRQLQCCLCRNGSWELGLEDEDDGATTAGVASGCCLPGAGTGQLSLVGGVLQWPINRGDTKVLYYQPLSTLSSSHGQPPITSQYHTI